MIQISVTLIAAIRIVETRISAIRIVETRISFLNVRVQISVQNVETRIWAPIGVRSVAHSVVRSAVHSAVHSVVRYVVHSAVHSVVRYVVECVRYPAGLEHVFHRHQALLAEPRELEQAVQRLPCSAIQQAQAHSLFVVVVASVASVAFVAVAASVLVLGRGKYASAAVRHQARRRALVEQRQSGAG